MSGRYSDSPDGDRRAPGDSRDELRSGSGLEEDAVEDAPEAWTPEEDLGEPEVAEAVGDTVEEAIENALEILGAREDEVEIEVLQTGQRGFLGIGKRRPFRVRVTWIDDLDEETIEEEVSEEEAAAERSGSEPLRPEAPPSAAGPRVETPAPAEPFDYPVTPPRAEARSVDRRVSAPRAPAPPHRSPAGPAADADIHSLAENARAVAEDLLRRMGMVASVTVSTTHDEIQLSVESDEDDALLIGRRGETRAAIEHLVHRLAIPRDEREIIVHLDVNGYWERRIERLRTEALELAAEATRDRQEIRTEPLSAQERRVIHRALADDPRVTTESIGSGSLKRVAIIPSSNR